jgi:DNA-binding protein HU-beta
MVETKSGRKPMKQSEVIDHFTEKTTLNRAQVKELFEELAGLASREVKENGEFTLPGFGKLVLAQRKAREGINPQTGGSISIPAKTALKFRISKSLKEASLAGKPTTGNPI